MGVEGAMVMTGEAEEFHPMQVIILYFIID
jgi:hypothetical protein